MNRVNQTKTPAKYLIIIIEIKAITKEIRAIYTMYFHVSYISLIASETTEAEDVARLILSDIPIPRESMTPVYRQILSRIVVLL